MAKPDAAPRAMPPRKKAARPSPQRQAPFPTVCLVLYSKEGAPFPDQVPWPVLLRVPCVGEYVPLPGDTSFARWFRVLAVGHFPGEDAWPPAALVQAMEVEGNWLEHAKELRAGRASRASRAMQTGRATGSRSKRRTAAPRR
jgi:hypothetical protein